MDNKQLYQKYQKFLKKFVSFKSVSTDPQFASEIEKTAKWLEINLSDNGFDTQVITGYENPVVLATYCHDPHAKTILIYGHYDVQPARLEDGWDSQPYELTEKNGRLFGRGAVDNKGQIAIYLVTVFELIKLKKLNHNIKFLIEGNEETGSDRLSDFIKDHQELFASDFVVISDSEIASGHPAIEVGFRGVINASITFTTSDRDLHSGLFGGSVPNAAHELISLIEKLYKGKTTIAIDGFYDDVIKPTKSELQNHRSFPFSKDHHYKVTGTKALFSENNYDFYTQTGLRPSIEITGFESGYNGVGFKNAVPHTATVKLNIRIVPNQDPKLIASGFEKFVKKHTPPYVTCKLRVGDGNKPIRIDATSELATKAALLLEKTFNKKVLYKYCGATIPIVVDFEEILHIPQVLIPFCNEDCNMHGANENFEIELIKKDISFAVKFLGM